MADRPAERRIDRLLDLAGRDPRRAARLALAWAARPAADPRLSLAIGLALLAWERPAEALDYLHHAACSMHHVKGLTGSVRDGPGHPPAARSDPFAAGDVPQSAIGNLAILQARQLAGDWAGLLAAWADLADGLLASGMAALAARARCEQVALLHLHGRSADARDLALGVGELVARAGAPADQARYAHVLGAALAGCGDLDTAESWLARAHAAYAALRRPADVARVRFERAWVWQRRERFAEAQAELEAALAAFRRFDLPLRIALCLKDLGAVAARTGDYGRALAYAQQARPMFAALGRRDHVARCDLNLGVAAHYCGLYHLALAAYARAATIAAEVGDRRLRLVCARNQALVLRAQGQSRAALDLLDGLSLSAAQLGDRLEQAELALARARALAELGAVDEARALLAAARSGFVAIGNLAGAAECQLEEGLLAGPAGEDRLRRALAGLGGRPAHQWRAYHGLARIAAGRGAEAEALAHYLTAGELVARLRRRLASEHASSAIFTQAERLYAEALDLAARREDVGAVLNIACWQQSLAFQRQRQLSAGQDRVGQPPAELEARRRRMADLHGDPAALDAALADYVGLLVQTRHAALQPEPAPLPPFDLATLREHLSAAYGAAWTVLAPVAAGAALLLAVLTPDAGHAPSCAHRPGGAWLESIALDAELQEAIDRACLPRHRLRTYRDLDRLRDPQAPPWPALERLGRRLISPALRARLGPDHRLLILPGAPLQALPWAALRVDGGWLCERAVIGSLPSLAALVGRVALAEGAQGPPGRIDQSGPALLLGCAAFDGRAADLPAALATLDLVAAHWRGPITRLENQQATRAALLAMAAGGDLRRYRLVHLASHAYLGLGRGPLAHLKLHDADLLVDEIAQLGLGGALVVLAACHGAAGDQLPGAETIGLSRAFLAAGARGVLASLWQIFDGAVLAALEPFYAALAEGHDPALALALAQRALIGGAGDLATGDLRCAPLVWAGLGVMSVG